MCEEAKVEDKKARDSLLAVVPEIISIIMIIKRDHTIRIKGIVVI